VNESPPGIRRVCIAIGVDGPTTSGPRPSDIGTRVSGVVIDACVASGLHRTLLTLQHDHETQIALLPTGIDEPKVIAALTAELGTRLRRLNRRPPDGARLRLTMAIHEGIVVLTDDGYRGYAIAKACQFVSSAAARQALALHSTADLLVLLSERIFDDLIRLDVPGLLPACCQRLEIDGPDGKADDLGWLYIPPHLV
jgi:hypothetical protein